MFGLKGVMGDGGGREEGETYLGLPGERFWLYSIGWW